MGNDVHDPFHVRDCTLIAVATGTRATSLKELKEELLEVPVGCLYYHFWGRRLTKQFFPVEYYNDFAAWVHSAFHDRVLTERLSVVDPAEFADMKATRAKIIEILQQRLEETGSHLCPPEEPFHFIHSQLIVFDTPHFAATPQQLRDIIPKLTPSSIYFHFIDAQQRTEGKVDDFSHWLLAHDSNLGDLVASIRRIDPYLLSLARIQASLHHILESYWGQA